MLVKRSESVDMIQATDEIFFYFFVLKKHSAALFIRAGL